MAQRIDYAALAEEFGGQAAPLVMVADASEEQRGIPRPRVPPAVVREAEERAPSPTADRLKELANELGGRAIEATFKAENEKDEAGNAVVADYPGASLVEGGKGFIKKAADRAVEFMDLARSVPVLGNAMKDITEWLHDMPRDEQETFFKELHRQLAPSNTAQEWGGTAEQVAEAILPAGRITKAAGWTSAKIGPLLAKYIGTTAGHLLPIAAVEGAGAGGIALLQGGDVKTSAAIGAALPVAGAALRGAGRATTRGVRRVLTNPNAAEREAVEFGMEHGIPVDLGTASGNRFVKGAQRLSDETLAGSMVAGKANAAREQGLATLGEQLAAKGYKAAITPEQAGASVSGAVTGKINQLHAAASDAYDVLRKIEADPAHANVIRSSKTVASSILDASGNPVVREEVAERVVPLAVNIADAKKALKPAYDQLMDAARITPPMGDKGRALVALDRLMKAGDEAPLSVVDEALGDLKAMARGAELPALRTQGQGVAAQAVKALDEKVRERASQAGPDAIKALMDGRAATRAKWAAADVLDGLKDESVKTVRALTAPKDSAIGQLRSVASIAPEEPAKVGRAFLDDMLRKATAEGSFDHAARMQATWKDMGAETKKLLFPDAGHVEALDKFFLLAKKLAENPNPSGTTLTAIKGAELGNLFFNTAGQVPLSLSAGVVSKMLRSPKVVKALTGAMQTRNGPMHGKAVQALIDASDEAGIVLASQAGASAERQAVGSSGARK